MLRAQMKFLEEMNGKNRRGNILETYKEGFNELTNIDDMIKFH